MCRAKLERVGCWVAVAVLAMVLVGLPSTSQAQTCDHGVTIQKTCQSPRASCANDASCDDGNPCTADDCPDLPNTTSRVITLAHADTCLDTTELLDSWDTITTAMGDLVIPAGGNVPGPGNDLPIIIADGNTTCTAGGTLPCCVGPAGSTRLCPDQPGRPALPGSSSPGRVRFQEDTYVIQPNDPSPLQDTGTVRVNDVCDSPNGAG